MRRLTLFLVILPLTFLTLPAYSDSFTTSTWFPEPHGRGAAARPTTLVRVLALESIGPDLEEHRLFSDPGGFITTLDALGRVGYQVNGAGLSEGAYHTLFVQLADEYEVIQTNGTRTQQRFTDENKPTRLRVRGMIMVSDGQATPMRMLEEPSYAGSLKEDSLRGSKREGK